jgi:hypothetical protein
VDVALREEEERVNSRAHLSAKRGGRRGTWAIAAVGQRPATRERENGRRWAALWAKRRGSLVAFFLFPFSFLFSLLPIMLI